MRGIHIQIWVMTFKIRITGTPSGRAKQPHLKSGEIGASPVTRLKTPLEIFSHLRQAAPRHLQHVPMNAIRGRFRLNLSLHYPTHRDDFPCCPLEERLLRAILAHHFSASNSHISRCSRTPLARTLQWGFQNSDLPSSRI